MSQYLPPAACAHAGIAPLRAVVHGQIVRGRYVHHVNEAHPAKLQFVHNLQLAAARYRLGLLRGSELPPLAMAALDVGFESSALCELSCEQHPTLAEHAPLIERVFHDCSVSIPAIDAAVDFLLEYYLQAIASGELPPREGLYRIVNDLFRPYISEQPARKYVGDQRDLEHLIGAFYSYDDLYERPTEVSFEGLYGPAAIPSFDGYVRQIAGEWLRRNSCDA